MAPHSSTLAWKIPWMEQPGRLQSMGSLRVINRCCLTVSCLVRYRENVILLMVFVSLPLLFLTGVSWPQSSIPGYLQGVSWLFPSTFGVRAYLRLNTMGATLGDITLEMRCLWIQVAAYLGTACLVYGHQLRTTQKHASERLDYLRKKREVRLALKAKGHNTTKTTD